jgi:hypothetical protein
MMHIPAPGSLADSLVGSMPLTRARTSGTAATRDVQAAHEQGRLMFNGQTPEESARDERSDMFDYYGNG